MTTLDLLPHRLDDRVAIFHGDCRHALAGLPDASIDAIVTDPPYEISFMGKQHDRTGVAFDPATWAEMLRVLKPGGHMVVFGATRTWHRVAVAVEDAGFEIRDNLLAWAYGCLTADTEVLTYNRGWVRGGDLTDRDAVRQWDPATGNQSTVRPDQIIREPWDGAMIELRIGLGGTWVPFTPDHAIWYTESPEPSRVKWERATARRAALMVSDGDPVWVLGDCGQMHRVDAARHSTYTGDVWCVTVPTGAFIVRHHGLVFKTGNSGFPKSMNVGKAIDAAAGAEREVVGSKLGLPGYSLTDGNGDHRTYGKGLGNTGSGSAECDITAPATEEAARWEGWGTALKPACEPVLLARKPLTLVPFDWQGVADVHHRLAGFLCLLLSSARTAETPSPSSPHALPEDPCASALVAAATASSPDESGQTDTFRSPEGASMFSNIASSWNSILDALSDPTSTSTTATRSSTTTALRILNSLLPADTSPTTMPRCECLLDGAPSSAASAESRSSGSWSNWLHTLRASVPESAIEPTALAISTALASVAESLTSVATGTDGSVRSGATSATAADSPAVEPIILARKPLIGTVASNVLAYGTGALNIDATRIAAGGADLGGGANKGMTSDTRAEGWTRPWMDDPDMLEAQAARSRESTARAEALGRWPSNMVVGGGDRGWVKADPTYYSDTGGASRFFARFAHATDEDPPTGRWPSNLVLVHHADCRPTTGTRKVRTGTAVQRNLPDEGGSVGHVAFKPGTRRGPDQTYADPDGTETIEEWACVPGCPIAALDEQSGEARSGWTDSDTAPSVGYGGDKRDKTGPHYSDTGGASRFFARFAEGIDEQIERDGPVRYVAKAPGRERPSYEVLDPPIPMLRLRADLTDEERAHVLERLREAGVDVD